MCETKAGPTLAQLEISLNSNNIFVKVDRIICLMVVRYPLGPNHPMTEEQGIHVVVFDESVSCTLLHSHALSSSLDLFAPYLKTLLIQLPFLIATDASVACAG